MKNGTNSRATFSSDAYEVVRAVQPTGSGVWACDLEVARPVPFLALMVLSIPSLPWFPATFRFRFWYCYRTTLIKYNMEETFDRIIWSDIEIRRLIELFTENKDLLERKHSNDVTEIRKTACWLSMAQQISCWVQHFARTNSFKKKIAIWSHMQENGFQVDWLID